MGILNYIRPNMHTRHNTGIHTHMHTHTQNDVYTVLLRQRGNSGQELQTKLDMGNLLPLL